LTPSRLITGTPELWYEQPLPWCFETTHALAYPRLLFLGLDAWFPSREPATMPEFRRGFAPLSAAEPPETRQADPREVYQEASFGMVARLPLEGLPVALSGMQPDEPHCDFLVPGPPLIELLIDGEKLVPRPLLTHLVIRPSEKKAYAVWCVRTSELPRKFVPGFHKNIPLAVSIDRGPLLHYESPPTVRDRLSTRATPGE
jgi:hypothetical protein